MNTWEWMSDAQCRGEDTELFFPVGTGGAFDEQVAEAKAVCRRCPVAGECLDAAIERPDRFGIFGGMTPEERQNARRRVTRRPRRKEAAA